MRRVCSPEVILSVRSISKKFCRSLQRSLLYGIQDIAGELLGVRGESHHLRAGEFWALQDVGLQLHRGEALGLVGVNGSGKTTLLRIISGLIKPDAGYVRVRGVVAPLIALGAGFNPILTGRENVFANMSLFGLSAQEIAERFDDVLAFAEIDEAIDAPVQSYSSGMAARLGFACAIYTEPDILLIDEVLAVGDVKFRSKCFRRLHELRQQGVALVLVSHSSTAILNTCDRAVYLQKGRLLAEGNPYAVINQYEEDLFVDRGSHSQVRSQGEFALAPKLEADSAGMDLTGICFRNEIGQVMDYPMTGEPLNLCVGIKAWKECSNVSLHVFINERGGEHENILYLSNAKDACELKVAIGEHEICIVMPYLGLKPGIYTMQLWLRAGTIFEFDASDVLPFTVKATENMSRCLYYQPRSWTIAGVIGSRQIDIGTSKKSTC